MPNSVVIAGAWIPGSSISLSALFAGLVPATELRPAGPRLWGNSGSFQQAENDRACVIADMRLDHADDLARELDLPLSARLKQAHAELLLAAWDCWGADCFARIEGDFAIAIWDKRQRRLILGRDAIGQRPLFFRRIGDGIAFASLPLPLAALSGAPRPDLVRLGGYLVGLPEFGERSYIEGVQRVLPGHFLIVGASSGTEQQLWWHPDDTFLNIGHEDAVEAVSAELRRTVRGMLRSAAPIIASDLTSGLDSSLVVATAAVEIDDRSRLLALTAMPQGPIDSPPLWFSDEASRAAQTAAMNGVRHSAVLSPPESPLKALERWFETTHAPIGNACNLGWIESSYASARAAGADTYLTGARGNFTVSRPAMSRLPELADRLRFGTLMRELRAYRHFANPTWLGLLAMTFGHRLPRALWNSLAPSEYRRENMAELAAGGLLRPGGPVTQAFAEFGAEGGIAELFAAENPRARRLVTQSVDEGTANLSVIRRHHLDVREPLSTRRMIELCARLPSEHYFRNGKPRALARDMLRGKAPATVIEERQRGWQGANWRAGFEPAVPEMLLEVERISDDAESATMFDTSRMRQLLLAWPSGNWNDWDQIETYRNTLFRAVGAARFARFVREWTPA